MPTLKISMFGSFAVTLDEQVVRAFETDKARALLAYLAVESGQAQRREKLSGLLWPNQPQSRALQSLSQALYSLRTLLGDHRVGDHRPAGSRGEAGLPGTLPVFLAQGDALQLNPHGGAWVDVTAFTHLLA